MVVPRAVPPGTPARTRMKQLPLFG
jgi:hypothetical protein